MNNTIDQNKNNEAEAKVKAEAEAKVKAEAEAKVKAEAEAKVKAEAEKVEIDLDDFSEEKMLEVLFVVLDRKIPRVENYVFDAIHEAGKVTKVDTKEVKKGCGAKVIEKTVRGIWSKYNGK